MMTRKIFGVRLMSEAALSVREKMWSQIVSGSQKYYGHGYLLPKLFRLCPIG